MDNPQPKVSEIEYGWLAGFFDGEGSIGLMIRSKAGKNEAPKIYALATISGTETEGLNRATAILEKATIGHYVQWWRPRGYMKNGGEYKQAWSIILSGFKRCEKFFQWITPALTVKKQRGELLLDYVRARKSHSDWRTPITEYELQLALTMRRLNQKGKGQPYSVALKLNTKRPGASSEQLAVNGRKGAEARWGIRN